MLKKSIRSSRCPRCRVRCADPDSKESTNDIVMAYGPKNLTDVMKSEDELKVRIWAYMRPPNISDPTPAVNPERLEKVRDLLSPSSGETAVRTHVDSDLSIQVMPDGSVRKKRSLREIQHYPPVMQMPKGSLKSYCLPSCAPASEQDLDEIFNKASCSYRPDFNKRPR